MRERYRLGEFELDAIGLELRRGGETVAIRRLPLRVLVHLVRHRDRVVGKEELVEAIWDGAAVSDAAIASSVRDLRRALGAEGARWIETQRRAGYRFTGPVEELAAAADADARTPALVDGEPFVGRAGALAALDAALTRAATGRGGLVLLAGEAGIGKTRLTDVLARRAEARGCEVLAGRCLEADGAPPFWPWLQILRALLARRSPAALRTELGAAAVDVARVMPEVGERLPELPAPPALEPRLARFRFLDATAELLVRARPGRARLLVLDDLHRADPSSLELLDHLVRSVEASRVLVVGTYRDTEMYRDPAVAALLGRLGRRGETELLGSLGRDDVARYCEIALGAPLDEAAAAALAERSGGNPFLLKLLVGLRRRRGEGADAARLPSGLAEAVLAQLDALSAEGRLLLRGAAVFGREFRPAAAARVAELRLEAALPLLEQAAEQRIVTREEPAGPHRFVHALIAEVLYAELPVAERLELHGRAGLALEALLGSEGEHAAELAHHFAEAAPAGFGEHALAACRRAASRAMRDLAYEESARLSERALAVLARLGGPSEERLALLLEAGEAWARHGSVETAKQRFVEALELARALGDADALGRAALGVCLDEEFGVPMPDRIATLENALKVVRDDGPLRVRLLGRLGYALWWAEPRERARAVLREAVALGRRVGDAEALSHVLARAHWVFVAPGLRQERLGIAAELAALAETIDEPALLVDAYVARLWDALICADRTRFDATLSALAHCSAELRQPLVRWWYETFRGSQAALLGRLEDAEAIWTAAKRVGAEAGSAFHENALFIQVGKLRMDQGRPRDAIGMKEVMAQRFPRHFMVRCSWLLCLAACGEAQPARELLRAQYRDGFSSLTDDVNWYNGASLLADTCREVEDSEASDGLYHRLLAARDDHLVRTHGWIYCGSVERHLGLLAGLAGKPDTATAHFERGIASERAMGARPSVATGLLDQGRMLLRHGDPGAARERLQEALDIAAELGMRRVEAQARALLAAQRRGEQGAA